MNEIEVIQHIREYIEDLGYNCQTSFGLQDHQPEMVIIDDFDIERKLRGNTSYRSALKDNDGNEIGENHHFYYQMTVDLEIRSENEVNGMEKSHEIKKLFRLFESEPLQFNEDTVLFKVGKNGRKNPFMEPTSLRIYKAIQQLELEFVDKEERTDVYETLEEIETDYSIS